MKIFTGKPGDSGHAGAHFFFPASKRLRKLLFLIARQHLGHAGHRCNEVGFYCLTKTNKEDRKKSVQRHKKSRPTLSVFLSIWDKVETTIFNKSRQTPKSYNKKKNKKEKK